MYGIRCVTTINKKYMRFLCCQSCIDAIKVLRIKVIESIEKQRVVFQKNCNFANGSNCSEFYMSVLYM